MSDGKKINAVRLSSGSYDDYSNYIEFVSHDKEYIEAWVKKYNELLVTLKAFYSKKWDTEKWEDQGDINFSQKSWQYDEMHEAEIIEIDFR